MATITKRTRSDGSTNYQVTIRRKGIKSISKTFRLRRDAEAWERDIETDLQRGALVAGSLVHTVSEAIDRYLAERLHRLKSAVQRRRHIEWWRVRVGDLKMANLTDTQIQAALRELRNTGRSAATANRYRAAISAVMEFARVELKWLKENPVALTTKSKESRGRIRFLSDYERQRLLVACKPYADLYLIVIFALTTGARQGEIMSLRWGNVDLKNETALIPDTKNGAPRVLPLSATVIALIKARIPRVGEFDWLFPASREPRKHRWFPKKDWDAAIQESGVTDFRFHDLRHTAASYLAQEGVSTRQLADMLGHKTLAMVQRYSHLTVESRRPMVDFLDKKITGK